MTGACPAVRDDTEQADFMQVAFQRCFVEGELVDDVAKLGRGDAGEATRPCCEAC